MDFCQSQKPIGAILLLVCSITALMADPDPPAARVTLAWDPSPSPNIAGYRLYEGAGTGNYTNVIDVGNVTLTTVSNLVPGTTYYFAVSAYDILSLESDLSAEVNYTVNWPPPQLRVSFNAQHQAVLAGAGPAGYAYDLLVSPDLQNWSVLTNLTVSTNGTCQFTDAASTASQIPTRFYRLRRTSP